MKKILVILCALTVAACSSQDQKQAAVVSQQKPVVIYTDTKKGVASIISNKALKSFNGKYEKAPKNKAFAQSLSGSWNWKSNRTSIEHAKTSALIGCQRNNKKSEDLYPCKIIHINDEWVD